MYEVLLAVNSKFLLRELKRLPVWGESTGFWIQETTDDFKHLTAKLRKRKYHLVLLEALPDNSAISLLQEVKINNLCQAVVMISEFPDFKTVRKSFLLGADDYFALPLEVSQFVSLFSKIENTEHGKIATEICRKEELFTLFSHVDSSIKERLDELFYHTVSNSRDFMEADMFLKRIMDGVLCDLFERYEWLNYYFEKEDFLSLSYDNLEAEERIKKRVEDFYSFFVDFSELYPSHGEGLDEILVYILNRPEGDLKQKTISEKLYINRSYLSTVFTAQLGINFVDYVNTVKMKRTAYLLKHTKMKIIDIAGLLDYKDMGYFLKKFKTKYGVTPSQYRIPETYEFQI